MENKDLKYIKKFYGEKMMHLCRQFFPTILDKEGALTEIMQKNFAPTRALYDALVEQEKTDTFRKYVMAIFDDRETFLSIGEAKSPVELLDEAGYILYPECKTEDEIQSFRKYYASGEELCTFRGDRLYSCRVWFAVKKNVDQIKRENFKNPQREDEYGTSVISIQFSRQGGWISIKNRYNHTVANPDSTFSNRLDNIAPTLDYSFRHHFGLPQMVLDGESTLRLDNFVMANDRKFYHVNLRVDNFCFCEDNVVLSDGAVTQFDKAYDILMDNILVNKRSKKVEVLSGLFDYDDSCLDGMGKIDRIDEIPKEHGEKDIVLTNHEGKNVIFTINRYNQIIGYVNNNITTVKDSFLRYNRYIKNVSLPHALFIGNYFLANAENVENVDIYNVEKIGSECMQFCDGIERLYLPYVKEIGDGFLAYNRTITGFSAPELRTIGDNFLQISSEIKDVTMPLVSSVGDNFIENCVDMKNIDLPNVQVVGKNFLQYNRFITSIDFPKLERCGDNFLSTDEALETANLLNLEYCGRNFLFSNFNLRSIDLPKLKACGDSFLCYNNDISSVNLPKLEECGNYFMNNNIMLKSISLLNLKNIGSHFMEYNSKIVRVFLPKTEKIGTDFMTYNQKLKMVVLPKLTTYGLPFVAFNDKMRIYAPHCKIKDRRMMKKSADLSQEELLNQ